MTFRLLALLVVLALAQMFATAETDTPPAPPENPPAKPAEPAPAAPVLSNDQIRELIRQAAERDIENDRKQRNYTYIQREEDHKLNGKGELQSTESKTSEVMILYEEQVERLIAKNDKPLPEKDAAKEEDRIQKLVDKRKNESEDDRKKRLEREQKHHEEAREFVREITDAYNFRLTNIDDLDGRETYVIDADPRPGFRPHRREAKMLPKFRFRVWIDKTETQWVKLDAQCIDTVSLGWFLARIHKGSRLVIEQTRVNDEAWLPKHVAVKVDVRLALVKNFNVEEDVTYRDYKKFRTETKIVPVGEVQEH